MYIRFKLPRILLFAYLMLLKFFNLLIPFLAYIYFFIGGMCFGLWMYSALPNVEISLITVIGNTSLIAYVGVSSMLFAIGILYLSTDLEGDLSYDETRRRSARQLRNSERENLSRCSCQCCRQQCWYCKLTSVHRRATS